MQTNRIKTLLMAITGAMLSVSCALQQAPDRETVLAETDSSQINPQDMWTKTVNNEAVDDGWLQNFEDARLDELINEVLANNKSLLAASAQVDAAAALARQAGAALKPTIGLGAGAAAGDDPGLGQFNSSQAFLNASWELDVWGRVRSQQAAAESAFRASESDFEFARQSIVAQSSKAWFLATQVHGQKMLAEEAVEIFGRLVKIVEARKRAGKAQPQDLPLARADLANAQSNLRQITSSYKEILRSIEILTGKYPSGKLEPNPTFVANLPQIPVGLPSDVLERRPDLIAAEQRVAAAFFGQEQAEAARLPKISLTAVGGTIDSGLADMLNVGNPIGQIGVDLFAPLYTGGALQAGVEIADAQKQAVMAIYAQKALQAFKEVETALENEQLFKERELNLSNVVKERQEALRIMEAQYRVGRVELYNLLQVQAGVLAARSSLIAVRNDRLAQRVNLHLALGGSFESDSAQVN